MTTFTSTSIPPSILRPTRNWSVPRSTNRVRIDEQQNETQLYATAAPASQCWLPRRLEEAAFPQQQATSESSTDFQDDPMDIDEPEPSKPQEPKGPLKRIAALELHRPISAKRLKLDSGAIPAVRRNPCSDREWVARVNNLFAPNGPLKRSIPSSDPLPSPRPTKRFKTGFVIIPNIQSIACSVEELYEDEPMPMQEEDFESIISDVSVILEDPDEEDVESDIDTSSDGSDFAIEFETDESSSALEDPMEEPLEEDVSGQSEIAATIAASNGLGSGYTESGKRYSLRQAKLLQDEEDASTAGFGSGMTEKGRRFSRRVANRGSGSN